VARLTGIALHQATDNYTRHGHEAAMLLAGQQATVEEIASVLSVTYEEAALLLARPPVRHKLISGWWDRSRNRHVGWQRRGLAGAS
jgi:hypothetical protein